MEGDIYLILGRNVLHDMKRNDQKLFGMEVKISCFPDFWKWHAESISYSKFTRYWSSIESLKLSLFLRSVERFFSAWSKFWQEDVPELITVTQSTWCKVPKSRENFEIHEMFMKRTCMCRSKRSQQRLDSI